MVLVESLSFAYQGSYQKILDQVSLSFSDTGFYLINGESGCGKSTFLHLLNGQLTGWEGDIVVDEISYASLQKKELDRFVEQNIAEVHQTLILMEHLTLKDHIRFIYPDISDDILNEQLQLLGLDRILDRRIGKMSAGEQQRCQVLMAFLSKKRILLCDEITANLDEENKKIILNSLSRISKERLVICVSHEAIYENYADAIVRLEEGKFQILKSGRIKDKKVNFPNEENQHRADGWKTMLLKYGSHGLGQIASYLILLLSLFFSVFGACKWFEPIEQIELNYSNIAFRKNALYADEGTFDHAIHTESSFFYDCSFMMRNYFCEESLPNAFLYKSFYLNYSCIENEFLLGSFKEEKYDVQIGIIWRGSPEDYKDLIGSFLQLKSGERYRITGIFYSDTDNFILVHHDPDLLNKLLEISVPLVPLMVNGLKLSYFLDEGDDFIVPSYCNDLSFSGVFGNCPIDLSAYPTIVRKGNDLMIGTEMFKRIGREIQAPRIGFYSSLKMKESDRKEKMLDPMEFHRPVDSIESYQVKMSLSIFMILSGGSFFIYRLICLLFRLLDFSYVRDVSRLSYFHWTENEKNKMETRTQLIYIVAAVLLFFAAFFIIYGFYPWKRLLSFLTISFVVFLLMIFVEKGWRKIYDRN